MSDDTPTQRFPTPDDGDLPTQRLDTAEVQEDLQEEKQKSKGLLVGLIVAGALLLVALIVLFFVLFGGNASGGDALPDPVVTDGSSPTPEPSDSPTTEPTPTPSATDDAPDSPQATTPHIDTFTVSPSEWACNTSAPVPVPDPQLSFSWSTTNATHVYFAVGSTNDAQQNGMGWDDLPVDGDDGDFPGGMDFTFNCPTESQSYTITATDAAGHKVSKTVTVTNTGDTQ
jgi:cytoskeletal protein RodZ